MGVRDIAVAIAGKTAGLPVPKVLQIEEAVTQLTTVVDNLRTAASARDAQAMRAQNRDLQAIVARIVALTAPS
jgi:hypothetical protein